jgi:predicted Rossmann fold nucleotide-binding protein DprA/Smf involved in DNA uptake
LAGHIWNNPYLTQGVLNGGGFLAEYETYVEPDGLNFRERLLDRDRIISGISDVFIAFECSVNSATVDTAKRAVNQGVTTFAVRPQKLSGRFGVDQLIDEGVCRPVELDAIVSHVHKIKTRDVLRA